MKCKKMMNVVASAALLLALTFSSAAFGQDDSYSPYNVNEGGATVDEGGATWLGFEEDACGGATWSDFEEETSVSFAWTPLEGIEVPLDGGLLVLALSGVCYAGAKRLKSRKK